MRIRTVTTRVTTVQAKKCVRSSVTISAIPNRVDWVMVVRMAALDLVQLLNEVSGVHVILKHFSRARSALADAPTLRLVVKF